MVHHSGNSISDRLLKLHGRCKTDAAKDMYVHEDVHKRLEITQYLGLSAFSNSISLLAHIEFSRSLCCYFSQVYAYSYKYWMLRRLVC